MVVNHFNLLVDIVCEVFILRAVWLPQYCVIGRVYYGHTELYNVLNRLLRDNIWCSSFLSDQRIVNLFASNFISMLSAYSKKHEVVAVPRQIL